ncbi:MAG: hypothetical protein Q9174_001460 [Haloplaca sp. 1 TL-2023]
MTSYFTSVKYHASLKCLRGEDPGHCALAFRDSLMDQFAEFRRNLFNTATKELNAFERVLKEDQAKHDEQIRHNQVLQNEVIFLRGQYARINELENTIKRSRERSASRHSGSSSEPSAPTNEKQPVADTPYSDQSKPPNHQGFVPLEEHEKCRRQFIECSEELERVKAARNVLEDRAKKWKKLYETLHNTHLPKIAEDHGISTRQGTGLRAGSAPASHANSASSALSSPMTCSNQMTENDQGLTNPLEQSQVLGGTEVQPLRSSANDPSREKQNISGDRVDSSFGSVKYDSTETSDESDQGIENSLPPPNIKPGERHSSNETPLPLVKSESDDLVVTGTHSLKRKRGRQVAKTSQGTKSIKIELSSSSPAPNRLIETTQASVDLDEISGSIYTPRKGQRKRRRIECRDDILSPQGAGLFDENVAEDTHELSRFDGDAPKTLDNDCPAVGSKASAGDEESIQKKVKDYEEALRAQDRLHRNEEMWAKHRLHSQRQLAKQKKKTQVQTASMPAQPGSVQSGVSADGQMLRPADPNRPLARTGDHLINRLPKPASSKRNHAYHVQILAEDGEPELDAENTLVEDEEQSHPSPRSIDLQPKNGRLGHLLAEPSPEKPPLNNAKPWLDKSMSSSNSRSIRPAQDSKGSVPQTPSLDGREKLGGKQNVKETPDRVRPLTTYSTRGSKSNPSPANSSTPSNPSTARPLQSNLRKIPVPRTLAPQPTYISPFRTAQTSKHTAPPLRSRPLPQLCLEDFRINPAHNQGYDYAFREVVRKSDQRKCLPGCTRLDCCGYMFRDMAKSGLYRPFHTTNASASTQEGEDQNLMEEYLGTADAKRRIRKMTQEEREEVLLQAKTKVLADHYGRHREVYAREPSPVGYWDVDMPNSQEAREQGRLAEVRMRQKVEERWKEAIKMDGLWKFKDEI